ncbi:hypothetical protein, partial [Neorhodopirellula pilleata]|uniref:hypothetical protein n=1 Tax=Neorhodopirellula pilleata TaxID=2714738 RepID=UPI001E4BB495
SSVALRGMFNAGPAGHSSGLPCGAQTDACPAGHCPTPDQWWRLSAKAVGSKLMASRWARC